MAERPESKPIGSAAALEAARRDKLHKIVELGVDPWGSRFDGNQPIAEIRKRVDEIVVESPSPQSEGDSPIFAAQKSGQSPAAQKSGQSPAQKSRQSPEHGPHVRAAGRIILRRPSGKVHWLQIRDWTGTIQVMIGKAQVGERNWELAQCLDLGDLVGVDGQFHRTMKGELTIFADGLHFLSKSIETPPEKWAGLIDPDLRQRMRYLDLIHTEGVLERFLRRTKIVQSIRRSLDAEGFIEVEGPTLHAIAGGAAARPFSTHHNALDIDLYLRIALELHLKRLLVGGIERVYELGRVYRNEGISPRHNPEFTMLEVYQAYGNYETMLALTEKIILDAIRATNQDLKINWGDKVIDFTPPFARKTYNELFTEHTGVSPDDAPAVKAIAQKLDMATTGKHPDVIKNAVFEEVVEKALSGPVFVLDYPASICPLTKRKRENPAVAERFELFIEGMEVANAYTELNDPDLQEELFSRQLEGLPEEESMAKMDRDFIRALRHGMPPAGGLGIGIDRLVMLLTNAQSIREAILFPLLRPEV